MKITALAIPDVKLIEPRKHGDKRGFLSETYSRRAFAEAGIDLEFVQENHTKSAAKGTVRGLHLQAPPHAQAKLLRVVQGAILDVAVDVRVGSPTYGRHVAEVLSAENWRQLLVPAGFAHGFCTLEPDTEVVYKMSDFYAPDSERSLLWNDPALDIDWPVTADDATVSDRDRGNPPLAEFGSPFD